MTQTAALRVNSPLCQGPLALPPNILEVENAAFRAVVADP
jgi:hypothetical protein